MNLNTIPNMYVPPFGQLLPTMGMTRAEYEAAASVTVPKEMMTMLLQIALASSELNEEGYLADNPDIRAAVQAGSIEDIRVHYLSHGYFEGRIGATPPVDERWYQATYPDVAKAIQEGALQSAKMHFDLIGAAEGRSPNAEHASMAAEWKRALTR